MMPRSKGAPPKEMARAPREAAQDSKPRGEAALAKPARIRNVGVANVDGTRRSRWQRARAPRARPELVARLPGEGSIDGELLDKAVAEINHLGGGESPQTVYAWGLMPLSCRVEPTPKGVRSARKEVLPIPATPHPLGASR